MKLALAFWRSFSWRIALNAAHALVLIIGIATILGFLAGTKWQWDVLAAIFFLAGWLALYSFEYHWRTRRTLGAQ